MKALFQYAIFVRASPATVLGLILASGALTSGGKTRRRGSIIEIHGGLARRFLESFPGEPIAMTLGHTIIGRTEAALDVTRAHELIHVRQYERWGPLMIPAYLTCSLLLWLTRRDPYRDNPFEIQAFREAP